MTEHQFSTPPSTGTYNRGCRCPFCVANWRDYQRRWHKTHPTKARQYDKTYQAQHPERRKETYRKCGQKRRARRRETSRLWRTKNPFKIASYRAKHKEWRVAWDKQRRQTERGRQVRQSAWKAYKARKRGARGKTSADQWKARWEYYGGLCYLCKSPAEGMDHVIPLKHNGSHWPANLRPCCNRCNGRKGAKPLPEYRKFLVAIHNKGDD